MEIDKGYRHYHISLFIFGWIYYLIVPAIATLTWSDFPAIENTDYYFKSKHIVSYFLFVTLWGLSFLIGSYIQIIKRNCQATIEIKKAFNPRGLVTLSVPIILYCQYVIISKRNYLFQGYLVELDTPFVGTIASTTLYCLFIFLYNKSGRYSKIINKIMLILLLEFSLVLIGLGSRMYVLIPIISISVYYLDHNIVSVKKLLLSFLFVVLFLLYIGIWRLGGDLSIDQLLFIGFAEPIYTWISAISMYDMNNLPVFSLPFNFLSTIINFIPTSLLPDKADLLIPISLDFESPFGATNIIVSLIANFGVIGSMMAIFCLGYILTYIRKHCHSVFGDTYYYCVCGIIPFQLFRDPVEIINKEFFLNLLILPLLIFFLYRIFDGLFQRRIING